MGAEAGVIVAEALDRIAMGASRPPDDLRGRIDQLKHLRTIIDEALTAVGDAERGQRTGPGVTG